MQISVEEIHLRVQSVVHTYQLLFIIEGVSDVVDQRMRIEAGIDIR